MLPWLIGYSGMSPAFCFFASCVPFFEKEQTLWLFMRKEQNLRLFAYQLRTAVVTSHFLTKRAKPDYTKSILVPYLAYQWHYHVLGFSTTFSPRDKGRRFATIHFSSLFPESRAWQAWSACIPSIFWIARCFRMWRCFTQIKASAGRRSLADIHSTIPTCQTSTCTGTGLDCALERLRFFSVVVLASLLQEQLRRHPSGDQLKTCVLDRKANEPLLIAALLQALDHDLVYHHDEHDALPQEHPGHGKLLWRSSRKNARHWSVLARDERADKRVARRDYYFQPPPWVSLTQTLSTSKTIRATVAGKKSNRAWLHNPGETCTAFRTLHVLPKMSPSTTSNSLSSFASKLWYAFKYLQVFTLVAFIQIYTCCIDAVHFYCCFLSFASARTRSLALSLWARKYVYYIFESVNMYIIFLKV